LEQSTLLAIAQRYGLGRDVRILGTADGTAGANVVIACARGKFLVRRRAKEHADPADVAFEHALLARLGEAGLPVARPLEAGGGGTWVILDAPADPPRMSDLFEVLPWIEGGPFEPGNVAQLCDLGGQLAAFHRVTAAMDEHREKPREDDPARLLQNVDALTDGLDTGGREPLLDAIRRTLRTLAGELYECVYGKLPQAIIHGDLHPGNVKFVGRRLVGFFDFDWANRQERVRDVCDALAFFASEREPLRADDIWSLTAAFAPDACLSRRFLEAYESVWPLTDAERRAFAPVTVARWCQARIRGMRKVVPQERLTFLDRGDFLDMLERLRHFAETITR